MHDHEQKQQGRNLFGELPVAGKQYGVCISFRYCGVCTHAWPRKKFIIS